MNTLLKHSVAGLLLVLVAHGASSAGDTTPPAATSRAEQIRKTAEANKARRAAQAQKTAQNRQQRERETQAYLQAASTIAEANAMQTAANTQAAIAWEQLQVQRQRNIIEAEQLQQLQIRNQIDGYWFYRNYVSPPCVVVTPAPAVTPIPNVTSAPTGTPSK